MEKLHLVMKLLSALPVVMSEIEEITEDRFISVHEVLCAIENSLKAFGLDPEKVGILITKDGDIHFVLKGVLKKEKQQNS